MFSVGVCLASSLLCLDSLGTPKARAQKFLHFARPRSKSNIWAMLGQWGPRS